MNRKQRRRKLEFSPPDPSWREAHPEFYRRMSAPEFGESKERLMWCRNEYWNAVATWKLEEGIWSCVQADTVIAWMRKMDPAQAKMELIKRGCDYGWVR